MPNPKQIKLALIGVGAMGTVHARRLQNGGAPSIILTALCDPDPAAAQAFPDIPYFSSVEELFAKGEIDAVFIATPHYQHTEVGLAALQKGLHVLVEKPMSANAADCERLTEAAERGGKVLSIMLSMRTKPVYQKVKELIVSKELGAIRRVNWTASDWFRTQSYYASSSWRGTWKGEGGGVLLNQCPHQLDLWSWFFGQPESVTAFCGFGRYHDIETEDDVTAVLHYPDGMQGVFIASTGESPGTDRLEIVGEMGRVIAERLTLRFDRNREPMTPFSLQSKTLMDRPEAWPIDIPLPIQNGTGHLTILENFAGAILRGETLIAPAREGIRSVELANAMQLSTWTRSTVPLPLDQGEYGRQLEIAAAGKPRENGHRVRAVAAL